MTISTMTCDYLWLEEQYHFSPVLRFTLPWYEPRTKLEALIYKDKLHSLMYAGLSELLAMGRGLQDVLLIPHGKMETALSEGITVPRASHRMLD